ncbi:class I SAM-dependent methyltransferase [Roseivirga sp.]|uniref:class I SAM-dependent methyltransferase n=1 Tax=Roseivirga sp. TaxID=1964215 RepID=UPI003B8D2567
MKCKLCGSSNVKVIYSGPFRSSGVGSKYVMGYNVMECQDCGAVWMDPFPEQNEQHYIQPTYWTKHKGAEEFEELIKKWYPEQLIWLESIGIEPFVNKKVLDYGCGMGLFLNVLARVSSETHGFDLSAHFKDYILENGHSFYDQLDQIPSTYFDLVVSFDTLEHIEKPKPFLKDIYSRLNDSGLFIIGVPNFDDYTKSFVDGYHKFFYHLSHLWFFKKQVLNNLLEEAGFTIVKSTSVHKYDVNNLVAWARDEKPTGRSGSHLDEFLEKGFRSNLERMGVGSHLLIIAQK